ncbi:MAG: GIY-YIG nuclease family protein [Candidatus Bipolaricaulia bacterium]
MDYFVYMLECEGNRLYTGYTRDLERRFEQHLAGRGGMFTRFNRPVNMVYYETHKTQRAALRREREIKRLSRAEKEELIKSFEGS